MSSIKWRGDHLIQQVGKHTEELGYVRYEENTKNYVLWCKDTRGVFGGGQYIRGDSFPTMQAAKEQASGCVSAFLFHLMWMFGLRDIEQDSDSDKEAVEEALIIRGSGGIGFFARDVKAKK